MQNLIEARGEIDLFFNDRDQHVYRQSYPDLHLDRIPGGAEAGLDTKMLLDLLEEQL